MILLKDEKIIELFFDRSEKAICELDRKYGKTCLKFSYNIVNNIQDAEECVNDTYLGVWNTIPPERPDPLLSFVLKITRNISVNRYWKNHTKKQDSTYAVALQEVEPFIASPNIIENEIEAKELAYLIEEFMNMLGTEDRIIFMRRYWFADKYKNIAIHTGLSEKNVSVRLTRIRQKLKEYLISKEVCT